MKLTAKPLAVIILVIMFGGILLSTALNWWQTESTKQPALIKDGEFSGQPDPGDIRGSYTFGDISTAFNIPLDDLAAAFAVPADQDAAAFSVKSLEAIYADLPTEIGTSSVRLFVAWYTGLPIELVEDIFLPQAAVDILKQKVTLTDEQIAYLDAHAVALDAVQTQTTPEVVGTPAPDEVQPAPTATHVASEDRMVKGKTTFREVLDWGVSQETIEQILGGPMPNPLTVIKDYCTEKGLSFETVKPALQAVIVP